MAGEDPLTPNTLGPATRGKKDAGEPVGLRDPVQAKAPKPTSRKRQGREGDVPEAVRCRYYVDARGGAGLGFYVDAQVKTPAFRDQGSKLLTAKADPSAVRDMTVIAKHRGWTVVVARGTPEFRREAWLAGRAIGLEVRGYKPSERDLQELGRRMERPGRQSKTPAREPGAEKKGTRDPGSEAILRTAEKVVRARIPSSEAQNRIIASARRRIADWLDRGARFKTLDLGLVSEKTRPPRERVRNR